jgi:hypothetical protein
MSPQDLGRLYGNPGVECLSSVVDPHNLDAYPGSAYHHDADPDAGPDSDFYLMRIWMQIRIFLFGSGCGSGSDFDPDADPDQDPDPSFLIKAQTL